MGCGYGTLGVVIQKLNPSCSVVSVDVNPRAVELTGINSQQNGLDLNAFVSDGFKSVEGTFDHIVSNPPIRAGKKVTINNSLSQACWGDFQGTEVTDPIVSIKEMNDDYQVILLDYIMSSVGDGGASEYYNVEEYYLR